MASALKNLSSYDDSNLPDISELKFGIVVAEWNREITHALFEGCYDTLIKHGAQEDNIFVSQVPGSFELPAGARLLTGAHSPDAVICLGCVIRGETSHNEYINMSVAQALNMMSIGSGRPYIFGVLTPNSMEQAQDRAGGKHGNKGVEAAVTAIRMADLRRELGTSKKKIGY